MAYFTKTSLQQYASTNGAKVYVRRNMARTAQKSNGDPVRARLFLSHSHADMEVIDSDTLNGIIVLLSDMGFDVYIDSLDSSMPTTTNVTTADRIKVKIRECDKFVLVATNNAVNSKWVPWELGYADGKKGVNDVAILPITDNQGHWTGNEYLNLYPQIQPGMLSPAVFDKGTVKSSLPDWVTS